MKELNPDTPVIRSLGGHGEWSVGSGIKDDNDFTDRVVLKRIRSLLVIGVRYHIGRIHIAEHLLVLFCLNTKAMEVMYVFRYL